MVDDNDLVTRVVALEKSVLDRRGSVAPYRWGSLLLLVLVLLFSAQLVTQVWCWRTVGHLATSRNKERLFWLICHPGMPEAERARAFLELVWAGNTEWRGAHLERLDLTGIQVDGASLQAINLSGCKMDRASLASADLSTSRLAMATLSDANLSRAILVEADLFKADLQGARLDRAKLKGATMDEADFRRADLTFADLTGSDLTMANLRSADLMGADLSRSALCVADLTSANLSFTNFSGADLQEANLSNANWWRARGLTPEMIADFQSRFAPDEDAAPGTREDYQRWLSPQPDN